MKKVLLATTALVLTAGFASAEVTFSGKADVGVSKSGSTAAVAAPTGADLTAATTAQTEAQTAYNTAYAAYVASATAANLAALEKAADTLKAANDKVTGTDATKAGDDFVIFTGVDLDIEVSATADSGAKFSTSFDLGGGSTADYDDDYALDAQDYASPVPTIKIEFGDYTVEIENDGIDNIYDDDWDAQDVQISGSMSGASFKIATDVDDSDDGTSYELGYTLDTLSLTLTGSTTGAGADKKDGANELAISYGIAGATVTASVDKAGDDQTNELGVSYETNGFTVGVTAVDPAGSEGLGDDWDISLGYAANGITANFATDEESEWDANATYDLGGGVSAYLGTNKSEFTVVGMRFTF